MKPRDVTSSVRRPRSLVPLPDLRQRGGRLRQPPVGVLPGGAGRRQRGDVGSRRQQPQRAGADDERCR